MDSGPWGQRLFRTKFFHYPYPVGQVQNLLLVIWPILDLGLHLAFRNDQILAFMNLVVVASWSCNNPKLGHGPPIFSLDSQFFI